MRFFGTPLFIILDSTYGGRASKSDGPPLRDEHAVGQLCCDGVRVANVVDGVISTGCGVGSHASNARRQDEKCVSGVDERDAITARVIVVANDAQYGASVAKYVREAELSSPAILTLPRTGNCVTEYESKEERYGASGW